MTFESSVAYIALNSPRTFIFEMIWKPEIRDNFMAVLREVACEYALCSAIIDSKHVVPTSRLRFYIVGVNVKKAGHFPSYLYITLRIDIQMQMGAFQIDPNRCNMFNISQLEYL